MCVDVCTSDSAESLGRVTRTSHSAESLGRVTRPSHSAESLGRVTRTSHSSESLGRVTRPSHSAESIAVIESNAKTHTLRSAVCRVEGLFDVKLCLISTYISGHKNKHFILLIPTNLTQDRVRIVDATSRKKNCLARPALRKQCAVVYVA